jgi:hypothetical protein
VLFLIKSIAHVHLFQPSIAHRPYKNKKWGKFVDLSYSSESHVVDSLKGLYSNTKYHREITKINRAKKATAF